jgi:hypothetical protein
MATKKPDVILAHPLTVHEGTRIEKIAGAYREVRAYTNPRLFKGTWSMVYGGIKTKQEFKDWKEKISTAYTANATVANSIPLAERQ